MSYNSVLVCTFEKSFTRCNVTFSGLISLVPLFVGVELHKH